MRKTILLLAATAFAIIILSSCSEAKNALMENCHLYVEDTHGNQTTLDCREVPVTTCDELAGIEIRGVKAEAAVVVKPCSDYIPSDS